MNADHSPVEPAAPSRAIADDPRLVLLLAPEGAQQHHAERLAAQGFRVVSLSWPEADLESVIGYAPALVAIELLPADARHTLELAHAFRQNTRTPQIPFIIYGPHLRAREIEDAARTGVLWLQMEPGDGAKLVAAVRGLLAASSH